MPDFIDDIPEKNDFRKKGMALSEEFAQLEGRRPRILVGVAVESLSRSMHKICNSLADIGFDVDIAPKFDHLKKLATQCLENDSDMILIGSENCISSQELLDFQSFVLPNQPDVMLGLYVRDPNCKPILKSQLKHWNIFDEKGSAHFMGFHLLSQLMRRT